MEVQIEKYPDRSVIILGKNVNIGSDAAVIQNSVLDAIQDGSKTVVIDLSKLAYITSWGIGTLFHALTTCRNRDVEFYLTGVNQKIHEILEKVKLLQVFTIKDES
jgi:anti-anti-sigma factor